MEAKLSATARPMRIAPEPPSTETLKIDPMAHVARELYDPATRRLDAKRVAEALDIPFAQIARALGVSPTQIQREPHGRSLQAELAKIAFCYSTLKSILGTRDQILLWMNAPHPDFGGRQPMSLLPERKTDMIVTLLQNALAGQMS